MVDAIRVLTSSCMDTSLESIQSEQRALIHDLQQQSMEMTQWTDDWRDRPPVLLIVGRQDPIFSVEDVQELADTLNGEVTVYGFADHVPQVGYARRFYRSTRRS